METCFKRFFNEIFRASIEKIFRAFSFITLIGDILSRESTFEFRLRYAGKWISESVSFEAHTYREYENSEGKGRWRWKKTRVVGYSYISQARIFFYIQVVLLARSLVRSLSPSHLFE